MDHELTRREFLRQAAALGVAAAGLGGLAGRAGQAQSQPTIAVASKGDPARLVRAAVEGMGGMGRFVKRGQTVLLKPNISWARLPEQAATTNPAVVAEVVRLCRQAGAREVRVMDHAIDRPDSLVLRMTGVQEAVDAVGGRTSLASSAAQYQRLELRRGKAIKSVEVMRDLRRADVFINVPIAKVHNSTQLTLSLKNLLGVIWDRGALHRSPSLDQAIADLAAEVKPDLVILDAVRILCTNGPKGPGRTEDTNKVVAGTDPLAVDAYAATLFGLQAEQIAHLARASEVGVGQIDLKRIKVTDVG